MESLDPEERTWTRVLAAIPKCVVAGLIAQHHHATVDCRIVARSSDNLRRMSALVLPSDMAGSACVVAEVPGADLAKTVHPTRGTGGLSKYFFGIQSRV